MIKKYYLPFNLAADVNYLYIFSLYDLAEYSKENKRRETIHYNSITGLADSLSISRSTLNRLLEKPVYKLFFSIDKEKKEILLYNNFGNDVKEKNFVVLTDEEVSFLRKQNDSLLCRYFIYLKKFCGIAKSKGSKQDFTAKQFLSSIGYSTTSGANLSKISYYNKLLSDNGFISISSYRDESGHTRNIYST